MFLTFSLLSHHSAGEDDDGKCSLEASLLRDPVVGRQVLAFLPCRTVARIVASCRHMLREYRRLCARVCWPARSIRVAIRATEAMRCKRFVDREPAALRAMMQTNSVASDACCETRRTEARIRAWLTDPRGDPKDRRHEMADHVLAAHLAKMLQEPGPYTKMLAVVGLGSLEQAGKNYIRDILEQFNHRDNDLRRHAVEALERLGPWAGSEKGVVPAVVSMLRDPCPHVCYRAQQALFSLSKADAPSVARNVGQLLRSQDGYVQYRALSVLGNLDRDDLRYLPDVEHHVKEEHPSVGEAVKKAISILTDGSSPRKAPRSMTSPLAQGSAVRQSPEFFSWPPSKARRLSNGITTTLA